MREIKLFSNEHTVKKYINIPTEVEAMIPKNAVINHISMSVRLHYSTKEYDGSVSVDVNPLVECADVSSIRIDNAGKIFEKEKHITLKPTFVKNIYKTFVETIYSIFSKL